MKRVAIVGIGIIDALGDNQQDCYRGMSSSEYVPPPYFDAISELGKQQKFFSAKDDNLRKPESMRRPPVEKYARYAIHSVVDAIEHLNIDTESVSVVTSNGTAGDQLKFKVIDGCYNDKKVKPTDLLQCIYDYLSGAIAQSYGWRDANVNVNAACAGSSYAIDYAMRLTDESDYVICTGADCGTDISIPAFAKLTALGDRSSPFDDSRNGFVMGSGAGTLVLQAEDKLTHEPIAWLHPASFQTDISSPTAPDTDGRGAKASMFHALKKAGIWTDQLAFICSHSTSTPIGDKVEYDAISWLIESKRVPVSAYKAKIGHLLSASTIVEIIYGIMALQHNTVIGNVNSPDCTLDEKGVIIQENEETDKRYFLKNSFGFGGKCASHVIEVC